MSEPSDGGELTADPVFLGLTRPTMILGIPTEAMVVNFIFTACAFIQTDSLLYLFAAVPIWGLLRLLCLHEPRFFDLLRSWAHTANATSYRPLPMDLPDAKGQRKRKDIEVIL